jgi:hypothetical protein
MVVTGPNSPDRGPAERRSEHGGGPGRGLEPPVRDEQVLWLHERFQAGPAGRLEGDVGRGDDHRHDQELGEAACRLQRDGSPPAMTHPGTDPAR